MIFELTGCQNTRYMFLRIFGVKKFEKFMKANFSKKSDFAMLWHSVLYLKARPTAEAGLNAFYAKS